MLPDIRLHTRKGNGGLARKKVHFYNRRENTSGWEKLYPGRTIPITQHLERVWSPYWSQMKALFTGFHMLYRLSQYSQYCLRYGLRSAEGGGKNFGYIAIGTAREALFF